jgi:hypothetical protein
MLGVNDFQQIHYTMRSTAIKGKSLLWKIIEVS